MKIIKSDDEGTLIPGTDRPVSKSLSTHEHTNANRPTETQPCVQVNEHTTQTVSAHPLFTSFVFPQTKATNSFEHTHALYSTALSSRASNQHVSDEQNMGQM